MAEREPISDRTEAVAKEIVDASFQVHKSLGPGLLESVYETCLAYELSKRGLGVKRHKRQVALPVIYDEQTLEAGLRLDLLVEDAVVVEIKAVERLQPVFDAQLLTYLKLSSKRLGFLINFNVPVIKDGIRRRVL